MVNGRARYIRGWMPRVNGNWPGSPISRAQSSSARSCGPNTALTGIPDSRITSRAFCFVVIRSLALLLSPRSGGPPSDEVDHRLEARSRGEHRRHTQSGQGLDVQPRDVAPHQDEGPQAELIQTGHQLACDGQVRSAEDRKPEDIDVLLQGSLDDLLHGLVQAGVDYLKARLAQRQRHDLRAAVVAVEAGLGDQHADRMGHAFSSTCHGRPSPHPDFFGDDRAQDLRSAASVTQEACVTEVALGVDLHSEAVAAEDARAL